MFYSQWFLEMTFLPNKILSWLKTKVVLYVKVGGFCCPVLTKTWNLLIRFNETLKCKVKG
jgi:hypothetical protein